MNLRKPTLLTLFLVVFIDLIGFGIVIPVLPYLGERFGASGWQIGLAFGGFSLMQFLLAPWWGKLSDRVGRRPIILVSLAGSTASYLLFAFADSIWIILLSRLLAGAFGANISVANAYMADITTKENRSSGMGLIGAAFGLGFILGPVIAALLSSYGSQAPSFFAAGLCGVNLIMAFFVLPESLKLGASAVVSSTGRNLAADWLYVLRKPVVGVLIVIGFFFNFSLTQWETTFFVYLDRNPAFHYDVRTFSFLLAYVGLLVALLQGGIRRFVTLLGEVRLLRIGFGLFIAGLCGLILSQTMTHLLISLTLLAFGMGCSRPVMTGAISIFSGAEEQGLVLGIFQGAGGLARILGPLLGGFLIDWHNPLPLVSALVIALIGLQLTLRLKKS